VEQPVSFGCPGKVLFRINKTGVYDPLGLFCLKTKKANDRGASLVVFPAVTPVAGVGRDSPVSRDVENDGLMRVVKGDDPSELYDIREYRTGDLLSRIHWKLSHKTGRLMVKELGRVVCGDVLVMFDLNGRDSEADALLSALASISASLSQEGVAHDIEWYSARADHINKSHVESEEDGRDALLSILGEGSLQPGPYVLQNELKSEKRNPYSKVVYLCSQAGMSDGDLAMLAKKIANSEVSVLLISEDGDTASGVAAEAAPRILRAKPADAAAALGETAL
jgi:uncharacterized protein (DUF58 family)